MQFSVAHTTSKRKIAISFLWRQDGLSWLIVGITARCLQIGWKAALVALVTILSPLPQNPQEL